MAASVDFHSKDYPEARIFQKFLSEEYDTDDLIFFLFLRSSIEKELKINLCSEKRGAKDTRSHFLGMQQCTKLVRSVFGSEEETWQGQILDVIERNMRPQQREPMINLGTLMEILIIQYHGDMPEELDSPDITPFQFESQQEDSMKIEAEELLRTLSSPVDLRERWLYHSQRSSIELVDLILSGCTIEEIDEIRQELISLVWGKVQQLVHSLFNGDKLHWLEVLNTNIQDVNALRHVEGLQRALRGLQRSNEVTDTQVEELCGEILSTNELRTEISNIITG